MSTPRSFRSPRIAPILAFALALAILAALALTLALPADAADAPKKADKSKADASAGDAAAKAKAQHDAMMAEMMKYAQPGPMHEFLKPLAGSWKTQTKMWMGPEPVTSGGSCERTWIMGGRYLQGTYKGDFSGMPFEGMEILGYDMRKNQFQSTWIDNMGTSIAVSTQGKADPATKTITIDSSFDDPITGQPTPYKMITKILDDNSHVFTMVAQRDGKDVTEMEITYTRAK